MDVIVFPSGGNGKAFLNIWVDYYGIYCQIGGAGGWTQMATYSATIFETWYHVACVRTTGRTLLLYINGILVQTVSAAGDGTIANNANLLLATSYNNANFIGYLDQVTFWNAALVLNDVNYYMAQSALGSPNVVFYWNFEAMAAANPLSNPASVIEDMAPTYSFAYSSPFYGTTCSIINSECPGPILCGSPNPCQSPGGFCYGSTFTCKCYNYYVSPATNCANAVTSAALTVASGSGITGAVAGLAVSTTITTHTVFNNLQSASYVDNFTATVSGIANPTVSSIGNSQYQFSYAITVAGVKTVCISLTTAASVSFGVGGTVAGHCFSVTVVPNALSPGNCYLNNYATFLTSGTGYTTGPKTGVYVQAADAYNNLIGQGGAGTFYLNYVGVSTGTSGQFQTTDAGNGKYTFSLLFTVVDVYTITVCYGSCSNTNIQGMPMQWKVVPGSYVASATTLSGNGIGNMGAGTVGVYNITAADAYGNKLVCPCATPSSSYFTLFVLGVAQGTSTLQNGYFIITKTFTQAGTFSVSVQDGASALIGQSPYTIFVSPGPVDPASSYFSSVPSSVNAGTQIQFYLYMSDQYGNLYSDCSLQAQLAATMTSATTTVNSAITCQSSNSNFLVALTPYVSGLYTLTVQYGGVNVGGSPKSVTVLASTINPSSCTVYGPVITSGTVTATGSPGFPFFVQAKDSFGNNASWTNSPPFLVSIQTVSGFTVTPVINIAASDTPGYVGLRPVNIIQTTVGSGLMYVQTTSFVAIAQSPYAFQVVAGPLSLASSSILSYPAIIRTGLGTTNFVFILSYVDIYGNPVDVSTVTATIIPTVQPGALPGYSAMTSIVAGQQPFQYLLPSGQTPGTYDVTISLTAGAVSGAVSNSPMAFVVAGVATISSFTPSVGADSGGVIVFVTGTNFVPGSPNCGCQFGALAAVPGTCVSQTAMTCVAPSGADGVYQISVTNDNWITNSGPSTQLFTMIPAIGAIQPPNPNTVYNFGGDVITFTGSSFYNSSYLVCVFSNPSGTPSSYIVQASFISSSMLTCSDGAGFSTATYQASVSNSGGQQPSNQYTFTVSSPQSTLCRGSGELSVAVQDRISGGFVYFPNLAQNSNANASAAGVAPANSAWQIVDGDRCCSRLTYPALLGINCGIKLPAYGGTASVFQVNLTAPAYVNEVVTSFYQPCRNLPTDFRIYYANITSNQWVLLVTHGIASSTASPRPCYTIPSDVGTAGLCIDYFTPIKASAFRVVFNNSAVLMPNPTDNGWLYEFEVHGILTTSPYFINPVPQGVINPIPASTVCTLGQTVVITFQDYLQNTLASTLSPALNISLSVLNANGVDVTAQILRSLPFYGVPANTATITIASNQIVFSQPPSGKYSLVFSSPGLASGTISNINIIVGPAVSLAITSPTPSQAASTLLSSSVSVALPTIIVTPLDVNGAPTSFSGNSVTASISAGPGSTFTAGSTTVIAASSTQVSFNNLALSRPLIGTYTFVFSLPGLVSTTPMSFIIVAGAPASFVITTGNFTATCYLVTPLPSVSMTVYDAGQNIVTSFTGLVTASSATVTLQGITSVTFAQGLANFNSLILAAPTAVLHLITFTNVLLGSVSMSVTVSTGPAVGLTVTPSVAGLYLSVASMPLPSSGAFTVTIVDAGGNTVLSGTSGMLVQARVSLDLVTLTSLTGPNQAFINNGFATFANLALTTPVVGSYSLAFAVTGLNPYNYAFTVSVGPAAALHLTSPSQFQGPATVTMALPVITIDIADAGGNIIGSQDLTTRTVSISSALSTVTVTGATSLNTLAGSSDTLTFNGLYMTRPGTGAQRITFVCAGLASVVFPVTISSGPGYQVEATALSSSLTYQSVPNVPITSVAIRVIDSGGLFVGNVDVSTASLTVTVVANSVVITGTKAIQMVSGQATFNNLAFLAPTAGVYSVNFTVPGLVAGVIPITIVPGPVYQIAIVTPASGAMSIGVCSTTTSSLNQTTCHAYITGVTVVFMDAGRDTVPMPYVVTLAITNPQMQVSIEGSTTVTIGATGISIPNTLIISPVIGTSQFMIGASGLVAAPLTVTLTPGTAVGLLVRVNNTNGVQSFNVSTSIPVVAVTPVDIFGNYVPDGLLGRVVTLSGVAPLTIGPATQTNVGGISYFVNVALLTGVTGSATIQATDSTGLTGQFTINLLPGQAKYMRLLSNMAALMADSTVIDPAPVVEITDGAGNKQFSGTFTIQMTIDIAASGCSGSCCILPPNCDSNTGICTSPCSPITGVIPLQTTNVSANGLVAFTGVKMVGTPGSTYQLRFDDLSGKLIALVSTGTFTLQVCDPAGQFHLTADPSGLGCSCIAGYYQDPNTKECKECPKGTFKPGVGDLFSDCNNCNSVLQFSDTHGLIARTSPQDCVCEYGYFATPESLGKVCYPCPTGGLCAGNESITNLAGYWRTSDANSSYYYKFYQCDPRAGTPICVANSDACANGYYGPLCGICEQGFGGFTSACNPCYNKETSQFIVVLVALMLLLYLTTLVFTSLFGGKNGYLSCTALKEYLHLSQSLAFLGSVLVAWPSAMEESFNFFGVSTLSPRILPIHCVFGLSGKIALIWYLFLPWISCAIMYGMYCISVYVFKMGIIEPGEGVPTDASDYFTSSKKKTLFISTLLASNLILHPAITYQVLSSWKCEQIAGVWYLSSDKSTVCYDTKYYDWLVLGILIFIGYCLFTPALCVYYFARNHKELLRKDSILSQRLSVLSSGFLEKFLWWDVWITVRKFILVLFVVFVRDDVVYCSFLLVVWFLFCVIVQLHNRPFLHPRHNLIEIWVIVLSYFTAQLAAVIHSQELKKRGLTFLYVVLLMLIYGTLLLLVLNLVFYMVLKDGQREDIRVWYEDHLNQFDEWREKQWDKFQALLERFIKPSVVDTGVVMMSRDKIKSQKMGAHVEMQSLGSSTGGSDGGGVVLHDRKSVAAASSTSLVPQQSLDGW